VDLTAQAVTQSKGFRSQLDFEIVMMIFCNRPPALRLDCRQVTTQGSGFSRRCAALVIHSDFNANAIRLGETPGDALT
jgi:hypothetical protein